MALVYWKVRTWRKQAANRKKTSGEKEKRKRTIQEPLMSWHAQQGMSSVSREGERVSHRKGNKRPKGNGEKQVAGRNSSIWEGLDTEIARSGGEIRESVSSKMAQQWLPASTLFCNVTSPLSHQEMESFSTFLNVGEPMAALTNRARREVRSHQFQEGSYLAK